MAIRQGGVTVIDDSRNVVNANGVMLNGDFTPYSGEGPNILWSAAGSLVSTFDNPNAYSTSSNDRFGNAVAISGNYAIVGAYAEDERYGTNSGKAYIFNVTTGTLLWTLDDPNPYNTPSDDYFGYSVAISGNYAIVGAYAEYDPTSAGASGKAYIYNVTTGALVYTLNNPNAYTGNSDDWFGYSVAISGNYAIVSAHQERDAGGTSSGKAYIFNVTTGQLLWTLNNENAYSTSLNDEFGYSVAISGNYAIVGARSEDDASGTTSGKAYIYNVTTGALVHTLDNPNAYSTSLNDQFGYSVAISDNYAIVGAWLEGDAGGSNSGKAYIYNVTTGALLYTLDNPNAYSTSFDDRFGAIVAISDNYAIVGVYLEDDAGGAASGEVYTFALNTTYRTGKPITTASDFGYVRKNAAGALVHTLNNPNAYNTSFDDRFGNSIDIYGNYAVVGAYQEDENAAGLGTDSGIAYVYNVTTGNLVYTLRNPNYYSVAQTDKFGEKVAISGKYIAVASSLEDSSGSTRSGVIYVFDLLTGSLVSTVYPISPGTTTGTGSDFPDAMKICGNLIITGTRSGGSPSGNGELCAWSAQTGKNVYRISNPINTQTFFAGTNSSLHTDDRTNLIIVGAYTANSEGIVYIFNASNGALIHTLSNPNAYSTATNDNFGISVAISGNYAIVGAYTEDDAEGLNSGKAYIYNVTTGQLVHTLNNPNAYGTSASDYFGYSVAISGNYAIVGVQNEDDPLGNTDSGKAYIYNATTGALLYTLSNPNAYSTSGLDYFGISVAISGNYAIVSAYFEDDAGGTNSGKAYIFSINDTYRLTNVEEVQLANGMKISADNKLLQQSVPGGALIHTLDNPNAFGTTANDEFGWPVAIHGNYAIVGARQEDDAGNTETGKAYIFDVTRGQLIHTLNNPNVYSTSAGDEFGYSVAITRDYAIVGAVYEDNATGSLGLNSGQVYVFSVRTGQLLYTLNNPNAYSVHENDNFGAIISAGGDYMLITASGEDYSPASVTVVYVFKISTGQLLHTLINPNYYNTAINLDAFGTYTNSISGNYAIIPAPLEDDATALNVGVAYIFDIVQGTLLWTLTNPNAYSTTSGDGFGYSAAISGNYAIVGARSEDEAGGSGSGKAYIYNVTTGQLVHTLNNPNAYSTSADDRFGFVVAMSGKYALVTADQEDDTGGLNSSKVYIFDVTTGVLVHTLDNPNAYSTSDGDIFGQAIAISDNYAIVGAPNEDDAGGTSSGKAYIFSVRDLTYLDRLVQMVS